MGKEGSDINVVVCGKREEAAFLDVVTREHGEVGDGEFEVREGGFLGRVDSACGEYCDGWSWRWRSHFLCGVRT